MDELVKNAPWRDKANRLIENLCRESYNQAQTSKLTGKRYKKHIPYTVPSLAVELRDCLNRDDELGAKQIFLSYEGLKATK